MPSSRRANTFRKIVAMAAVVLAILAFSPQASGAILTWTLGNVTFANGETLSGWIQIDTNGSLNAWNLTFGGLPSYDPVSLVGTEAAPPVRPRKERFWVRSGPVAVTDESISNNSGPFWARGGHEAVAF